MKPYTVILLRGRRFEELADGLPFGTDAYAAHVEATERMLAIKPAIEQVLDADRAWAATLDITLTEDDYIPLVVLEGHANPVFWGWQGY